MRKNALFLSIASALLLTGQSNFFESDERRLNRLLSETGSATDLHSPLVLENTVLFFYIGAAKDVFLAGDFNNWKLNLKLKEHRNNLWVFSWTNRTQAGSYKYRFVVDGFWIPDPTNPNFVYDAGREKLSLLTLTNEFIPDKKYPLWISNDVYRFQHVATNAKVVSLAGDFNNWNPYSHQMKYQGGGLFSIDIILDPKKLYLYSFVEDGMWVFDANNKKQYRNQQNRAVSAFFADRLNSKP